MVDVELMPKRSRFDASLNAIQMFWIMMFDGESQNSKLESIG